MHNYNFEKRNNLMPIKAKISINDGIKDNEIKLGSKKNDNNNDLNNF